MNENNLVTALNDTVGEQINSELGALKTIRHSFSPKFNKRMSKLVKSADHPASLFLWRHGRIVKAAASVAAAALIFVGSYAAYRRFAPKLQGEEWIMHTSSLPEDSGIEIVTASLDVVFYDIDELIKEADVIMIGEYLEEGQSKISYDDPVKKTRPHGVMTFNTLKAIKVYKGEEKLENGTLPIYECYAYNTTPEGKEQLLLHTSYVPMHKGDKAIFVLGYNKAQKRYGPFEYEGRFPLPEDLGKKDELGFTNGMYKEEQFNEELYNQLIERFNISKDDYS